MRRQNPVRGATALVAMVAGLAACTSSGTPSASGSGTPTPAGSASTGTAAPAPAGSGACAYLTAADVQTALNESVSASKPMDGAQAPDGSQIAECVLSTSGPPLLGGAANTVATMVAGLIGKQPDLNLTTGGIAVIVTTTATPITASASGVPLPSGASSASGIGKSAYSVPSPTGGGLAVSQVTDTKTVIILDLEGKQITADQLTALLKAAVARA